MITFRNFALRRGERLLLSSVDLALHDGWRIGMVGRNGCGKTSLFATLQGELEPDAGDLDLPPRLRIASVAQETPALPDPAIDYVLGGDVEVYAALRAEAEASAAGDHEAVAAAHHRIEELHGYDARARAGRLMHGLGFAASTHEQPVASFSGGWRVRLNLARALMAPSDLLLLDEPTNHLDLDAVLWLEQWLLRYPGMLLIISHDREFLDGVCTHVVHLHDGRAKLYLGDYTSFERQRAEQLRQQQIAHEKEQATRAHLQSFIDRFKAKASKAKQAQSRMKRLEKLAGTEAVRAESPFRFAFPTPAQLPSPLLRLDGLEAGYTTRLPPHVGAATAASSSSPDHPRDAVGNGGIAAMAAPAKSAGGTASILREVKFSLEPGDRVALLGPNGAGKSTLVKTLVGELPPLAGDRMLHPDAKVGYFAQHTVEALHEGQSPMQHLADIAPKVSEQVLRNFLGRWNFAGDRAFEPVDGFSGGERARLALALIAWTQPNLLLLDEPTNHLDMEMREALAEALAEFNGALVLVSHDRHLIGMCCDSFWRVADGSVTAFDGDLDDYANWLRRRDRTEQRPAEAAAPVARVDDGLQAKDRRRLAAEQRERERPLRNRLKSLEQKLVQIDRELAQVESRLADPEIYARPGNDTAVLLQRQGGLRREKEGIEEEWLMLTEKLETGSA
jgi:ATP-binding cassette, subfamily F, member 3